MNRRPTRTRKFNRLWPLLLTILLSGCAANYLPQARPGVMVEEDVAILRLEGSVVTLAAKSWVRTPENLNDYYTTFYLTVKNTGDAKLQINPGDLVLLDSTDRQYDVVPVDGVESMMISDNPYPNPLLLTPEQQDEINRKRAEARKNLWQDSFSFGEVIPQAVKTGFVFFNRLPWDNQRCRILYRGTAVEFSREKP